MQINFQYTPAILQKAHELHYKKFFPVRSKIILWMGLLAIWAGVLLLILNSIENNLVFSIPLLVYGVVAIAMHFYLNKTIGKRAFKKLKEYQDQFSIQMNDSSIIINIHQQEYQVEWEKFNKALLDVEMILLYPSDSVFFIFPKSTFSENEFEVFENLVKEKVQKIF